MAILRYPLIFVHAESQPHKHIQLVPRLDDPLTGPFPVDVLVRHFPTKPGGRIGRAFRDIYVKLFRTLLFEGIFWF